MERNLEKYGFRNKNVFDLLWVIWQLKPILQKRIKETKQASALTRWLRLFPAVIKALKAPWVLQSQLVVQVPEQQGHEDDEESNGSQKAQHLWRDWKNRRTSLICLEMLTSHHFSDSLGQLQ